MAWYEYQCSVCGAPCETQQFAKIGRPLLSPEGLVVYCGRCGRGAMLRRVSLPQTRPTAEPYYNHSINAWVKDDADFQRKLHQKSIENSELTGTQHNFQPVYPGDLTDPGTMKKLGVGLDGGYAIENARRNNPAAKQRTTRKIIV